MFWLGTVRLNTKGNVHKHCSLADEVFSSSGYMLIMKFLHTYNGNLQISKRMIMVGVGFLTIGVGIIR